MEIKNTTNRGTGWRGSSRFACPGPGNGQNIATANFLAATPTATTRMHPSGQYTAPLLAFLAAAATSFLLAASAAEPVGDDPGTRDIAGWRVHVRRDLLTADEAATLRALELLRAQLEEINRVVPPVAAAKLRKVPLWFSPEYPGDKPRAAYHPSAAWLRAHGRDPAMARSVEFTNVRIFEAETRRMPNFALHELAHAYHDRFLPGGFQHPGIVAAYERAKAGGTYDRVERQDSEGRKSLDRAYALTNPQEYFAESTEAFFSRNDFFPYTRAELRQHDPGMFALLAELWGVALD